MAAFLACGRPRCSSAWPPWWFALFAACQVACLFILNWAAPGLYRGKTQKWHTKVLGQALQHVPGAIGVLVSPVYFHKEGNLWACKQAHLQMLSTEHIKTDRMATLLFKSRMARETPGGQRTV